MLKASDLQLSKIEQILQQMDASQGDSGHDNRRQSPRVSIRTTLSAVVLSLGGNRSFKAYTRNISTSGIGFVCRRFCRQGENLVFTFRLPGRSPKLVLTQVSFSRYVRAGLYEVGVAFIECAVGADEGDIPGSWLCRDECHSIPAMAATGADSKGASRQSPATVSAGQVNSPPPASKQRDKTVAA